MRTTTALRYDYFADWLWCAELHPLHHYIERVPRMVYAMQPHSNRRSRRVFTSPERFAVY